MSINSRRPRQSRIMPSADVTRAANALIQGAETCPGCDLNSPWYHGTGPTHGQTCRKLRDIVRENDRRTAQAFRDILAL
jgi:hypothetical protein